MTSGVGCTLWADGVRVADGSPGDPDDVPTGLSGLAVTWGRETTVDQPSPSTCTVRLMDTPGASSFADVFHVGTRIDVTAAGTVFPDPTVSTFTDPGFEAGPPNVAALRVNLAATRSTRRAHTGAASAALAAPDRTRRGTLILAPAPFAPSGTDPGAWDAIPATATAQVWSFGASVWAPPGARVLLRPALFSGPWADAAVVEGSPVVVDGPPATSTAPTWQVVSGTFTPSTPGAWVGLSVEVWPSGQSWNQVEPGLSWDALGAAAPAWSWDDTGTVYVDDVAVLAPAAGTAAEVLVFAGRVTDLTMSYDESIPAPVLALTAADFTADLANIGVGDEPWAVETMDTRVQRIMDLAMPGVPADVDASVAATLVTWRDVDHQAAAGLLVQLAESVDAVMWSATHRVTGPYLTFEDPATRPPAEVLALVDGVVVITSAAHGDLVLSACDLLLEPVTWVQDVADITSRVAVTWLEQGVDGEGQPATTERTQTALDPAREAAWGYRALSVASQLQAAADADAVAARILARTGLGWRMDGVTLDDDLVEDSPDPPDVQVRRMLALLDGTARNGALLQLVDLPAWSPYAAGVSVFLEGGQYTFEDGRWVLDLTVSDGTGTGTSVAWDDLPASTDWAWDDFDPSVTWDRLRGVGLDDTGA